jgi:hypothetical protein
MSSNSSSCSRSLARGVPVGAAATPVSGSTSISVFASKRSSQTKGRETCLITKPFMHTEQSMWTFAFVRVSRTLDMVRSPLLHTFPFLNMQLIVMKFVVVLTGMHDRMHAEQIVHRLKHMTALTELAPTSTCGS